VRQPRTGVGLNAKLDGLYASRGSVHAVPYALFSLPFASEESPENAGRHTKQVVGDVPVAISIEKLPEESAETGLVLLHSRALLGKLAAHRRCVESLLALAPPEVRHHDRSDEGKQLHDLPASEPARSRDPVLNRLLFAPEDMAENAGAVE
jgi:hypothetical protein